MVFGFNDVINDGATSGNIFTGNGMGGGLLGGIDSMTNTGMGIVSLLKQIKGLGQEEQLTDEEKYRRNFYQQALNNQNMQQPNQQQFGQGGQLTSLLQPQQPQQPYNFNNYGRMY